MSERQQLLSITEVAQQLSVSKDTVRRMIQRGDIKQIKIMGCVRVPREELQQLLQESGNDMRVPSRLSEPRG